MSENISAFALSRLVCPISKRGMNQTGNDFTAPCGFSYRDGDFRVGLEFSPKWESGQQEYVRVHRSMLANGEASENYYSLVDDETSDIYGALRLEGTILDVGGGMGALLAQADLNSESYVCLDPIGFRWNELNEYAALKRHYRKCEHACRILANAEFLPFADGSFETVHMRSCLDHFANPSLALKEGWRVLANGGRLIVGIALEGAYKKNAGGLVNNAKNLLKQSALVRKIHQRFFDHHAFHPTRKVLINLIEREGFSIETELWQKAYHNVVYISARRR